MCVVEVNAAAVEIKVLAHPNVDPGHILWVFTGVIIAIISLRRRKVCVFTLSKYSLIFFNLFLFLTLK